MRLGPPTSTAVASPGRIARCHDNQLWAYCGGPEERSLPARTPLGGDGQLVANTRLDDVSIPLNYEIGVTITPGPTIDEAWASIVHFTATGDDWGDYGDRIPGVWFWPGTRKLLVVDGHRANGNSHTGEWGCDDGILTLSEGVASTLTMRMNEDVVNIYVDGEWACGAARSGRQVWEATQVYAADPWYAAADAAISDLYLSDLAEELERISSPAELAPGTAPGTAATESPSTSASSEQRLRSLRRRGLRRVRQLLGRPLHLQHRQQRHRRARAATRAAEMARATARPAAVDGDFIGSLRHGVRRYRTSRQPDRYCRGASSGLVHRRVLCLSRRLYRRVLRDGVRLQRT